MRSTVKALFRCRMHDHRRLLPKLITTIYNYIMKKQVVLVGILLASIITSLTGLEQQNALARTSSEDRHVGFSDGCKGVPLVEDHTESYLDGYSEGQAQCHNNNGAIMEAVTQEILAQGMQSTI
jgi:hypothetical protein